MIKIYTLNECVEWRSILNHFDNTDIYYFPEYVTAYRENGDGEPILIHYVFDDVEAINVVIKRDISNSSKFSSVLEKNKYFDFITPYGYGGILFKEKYTLEQIQLFIKNYNDFFKEQQIVSEFIRFSPILKNYEGLDNVIEITQLGPTVYVNTKDIASAWDNLSSKNRNMIRKSIKNDVKVYWGLSEELISQFISMYKENMDRDKASDYYYFSKQFFRSMLEDLKYNMLFFYAVYQNKIIAMSSIIFSNKYMHYHLSAADFSYRHVAPTNLILFEVINFANRNGFDLLHLGGGLGGKQDSLYSFKKSFNRLEDKAYYIGKIIFNQETYSKLSSYSGEDARTSFFPKYRNE